jgi:hypothetical protein
MPLLFTVIFTAATTSLLWEYGRLHSQVLSRHYSELGDDVRGRLFSLLGWLHVYRLCAAALAVTCAVWALFSRPRWVGIVALVISLFAVFQAMIVM